MLNREDRVVSVQQPDGSLTVDHTDGTRITTLFQGTLTSTPRHATSHISINVEVMNSEEDCSTRENERSVLSKERVMMVEKEGCATVVLYPQRQAMRVFLADGTAVTANNKGAYEVRDQQQLTLKL